MRKSFFLLFSTLMLMLPPASSPWAAVSNLPGALPPYRDAASAFSRADNGGAAAPSRPAAKAQAVMGARLPADGNLNLVWAGTTGGVWNAEDSGLWKEGSLDRIFKNGDSVTFAGNSAQTIQVQQDVVVSDMKLTGAAFTFEGGQITGDNSIAENLPGTSSALTITGGSHTFKNPLNFTGGQNIHEGAAMLLTERGQLSPGSAFTNNGRFQLQGTAQYHQTFRHYAEITGTGVFEILENVTIAGGLNVEGTIQVTEDTTFKMQAANTISAGRFSGAGDVDLEITNPTSGYHTLVKAENWDHTGSFNLNLVNGDYSEKSIIFKSGNSLMLSALRNDQNMLFWKGGSGEWNSTSLAWTALPDENPVTYQPWINSSPGMVAVFEGAGGDIAVSGDKNFEKLQFKADNYSVSGDTLAISPSGSLTYGSIEVDDGFRTVIDLVIDDGGRGLGLWKEGRGTLVLMKGNTYSGPTEIKAGTLEVMRGAAINSSSSVTIAENSQLALNFLPGDTELTVDVSGAGGLTVKKDSNGATINSNLTYSGETRLEGGTLLSVGQAGTLSLASRHVLGENSQMVMASDQIIGGLAGDWTDSRVYLLNDASLTVITSGEDVFNGEINLPENSRFIKKGAGHFTMAGTMTTSGPAGATIIEEGFFTLAGTSHSPLTVKNEAGLGFSSGGRAETTVDIESGGYLEAGSGGSITNLTMAAGSWLRAVPGSGALSVTGVADIADGILPTISDSNWQTGQPHEILKITDAYAGQLAQFDGQKVEKPAYRAVFSLEDDTLSITVTDIWDFSEIPDLNPTPNESQALGGIGGLPREHPVKVAVLNLNTTGEIKAAANQLSGESLNSIASNVSALSRVVAPYFLNMISARSIAANSAFNPAGEDSVFRRKGLWFTMGGSYNRFDGDGGTSASTLKGPELSVGYDLELENGFIGGLGFRFSDKDFEGKDAADTKADIKSITGLIYGGREINLSPGTLRLALGTAFSVHSIDSHRTVAFTGFSDRLSASYHANSLSVFGEAAYARAAGEYLVLEPYAGLSWDQTRVDSFEESGGAASLDSRKYKHDNASSRLGLRAQVPAHENLTLRANAGWQHTYGNLSPKSVVSFRDGSDTFSVQGASQSRDALNVGLGLEYRLNEKLGLHLDYQGSYGDRDTSHSGSLTLRLNF